MGSRCSLRAAKLSASAEPRSSQCVSSTRTRSGPSSATSLRSASVALYTAYRSTPAPASPPSASSSASRWRGMSVRCAVAHRREQLRQPRVRQLGLALDPRGLEDGHVGRPLARPPEQRALADPGCADEQQRAAAPLARRCQAFLDPRAFGPPSDQHALEANGAPTLRQPVC